MLLSGFVTSVNVAKESQCIDSGSKLAAIIFISAGVTSMVAIIAAWIKVYKSN